MKLLNPQTGQSIHTSSSSALRRLDAQEPLYGPSAVRARTVFLRKHQLGSCFAKSTMQTIVRIPMFGRNTRRNQAMLFTSIFSRCHMACFDQTKRSVRLDGSTISKVSAACWIRSESSFELGLNVIRVGHSVWLFASCTLQVLAKYTMDP